MNKFRGKALALVLSLALVASSFPVTLASAASKTQTGLLTEDPDNDEFWLVNGEDSSADRTIKDFSQYVYKDGAPLKAKNGESLTDIEISTISHVSGDRVVKWDIDDNDDGDDNDTELSLRNSDSTGDEVIAILYKGIYTDDDDNEITVKGSTQVTIHAVDKNATVIGDASKAGTDGYFDYGDDQVGTDSPELEEGDDDFATLTTEAGKEDSKELTVYRAVPNSVDGAKPFAQWQTLKTVAKGDLDDDQLTATGAAYSLKSSNKNILLSSGGTSTTTPAKLVVKAETTENSDGTTAKLVDGKIVFTKGAKTNTAKYNDGTDHDITFTNDKYTVAAPTANADIVVTDTQTNGSDPATVTNTYTFTAENTTADPEKDTVTATVDEDSSSGNVTLTAEPIEDNLDEGLDEDAGDKFAVADDDDDVKVKVKLAKKVLINTTETSWSITKDGSKTQLSNFDEKDNIANYSIDVDKDTAGSPTITIDDDAKIDTISGTVKQLTIGDGNVSKVDLDAGSVLVNDEDAKVGDIHTEGDASNVSIDAEVSVGNIETDAATVTIDGAKAGDITTDGGAVDLKASDDDTVVSVGTVTAKDVTIDPDDGQITVAKIVSDTKDGDNADDASIVISGSRVKIGAIDFNSYATDLKTDEDSDGFQGTIPAPQNAKADGALIETTNEDDDVTVTGDLDIDGVTVDDEDSELTLDGKADIDTLDGSGTLYVAKDALYIGDSASGVKVKLTDSNVAVGDTVFTAASDAVDEDDLDFYGFTVAKDEGSSTDTFKVDELALAGLAASPASAKIALGYTQTLTASAYAPGTALPEGYSIEWDIEDNSGVFELTDNGDGTATVTTVDYDETFADENKATAVAYLVDEDGDEDEDYAEAEVDLTALKVPEATSDTTADFSVAPGASYTFKITSATQPTFTVGTAGVFNYALVSQSGSDYFYKITAIGKVGDSAGIYLNGEKLLVATIKSDITSDTTQDVTVAKGSSYTYKITTSTSPSFAIGTAGAFTYSLVGRSGNDYFYKITAVGNAGAKAGIYVNGQKINVATVG